MADIIEVMKWKAIPNKNGGYDIHCPGSYDTFRGWAANEKVAREILNEKSGYNYQQLPEVKYSELTIQKGKRIKLFGGWYEHTIISLNGVELGRFQLKRQFKRETAITYVKNSCVQGHDIRWLLATNGHRYVNDLDSLI